MVSIEPLKIILFFWLYWCSFTEITLMTKSQNFVQRLLFMRYLHEKANLYSWTSRGMNKAINHYLPLISRRSWHVLLNVPNYDHGSTSKGIKSFKFALQYVFPLEKVAFLLIAFVRLFLYSIKCSALMGHLFSIPVIAKGLRSSFYSKNCSYNEVFEI